MALPIVINSELLYKVIFLRVTFLLMYEQKFHRLYWLPIKGSTLPFCLGTTQSMGSHGSCMAKRLSRLVFVGGRDCFNINKSWRVHFYSFWTQISFVWHNGKICFCFCLYIYIYIGIYIYIYIYMSMKPIAQSVLIDRYLVFICLTFTSQGVFYICTVPL